MQREASHCKTAGGYRGGRKGWPPRLTILLNSIVLSRDTLKKYIPKEFLSIGWYYYLPFHLRNLMESFPQEESRVVGGGSGSPFGPDSTWEEVLNFEIPNTSLHLSS